ncbi:hypothetical protein H5T87_04275 [bacterium]|nr:hypothetical protein [bacterium]
MPYLKGYFFIVVGLLVLYVKIEELGEIFRELSVVLVSVIERRRFL